jgi:hypothetical protein
MVALTRRCILAQVGSKNQCKNEAVKVRAKIAYDYRLHEPLVPQYFIPRTEASLCLRSRQPYKIPDKQALWR